MIAALSVSMKIDAPVAAALIALAGVLINVWVIGDRAERRRRRDLHGEALASVLAYREMPFVIRRRRWEPEYQSEERTRISDRFSKVKAEIERCRMLLRADGDSRVSDAFEALYETARKTAGTEAHNAWKERPVKEDSEMNMSEVFDRLRDLDDQVDVFTRELAWATLPRRKRLWRRVRRRDPNG